MIGAGLQTLGGWRLVFVFLLAYAALVCALLVRFLPKHKTAEPFTRDILRVVLARYRNVLATRPALGFLCFQAASFSSMLVFLTESPFVYMQLYGLTPHQYAWAFAGNIGMMALFNRTTAWRLRRGSPPESILLTGIAVQLSANTALAAMTWGGALPSAAGLLACAMVSVGTQGFVVANTQALFMEFFRENGGSANALLLATASLAGAGAALLATTLHNGTAQVMGGMMLACTVSGLALLSLLSPQVWRRG
nr:hypothetical protein LVJ77_04635 [Conchiformibius kuhniae]